jgi:hypothetical protein
VDAAEEHEPCTLALTVKIDPSNTRPRLDADVPLDALAGTGIDAVVDEERHLLR